MSSNSTTGSDGFPAILLKKCKGAPARSLYIIFQSFFAIGRLPRKLKEGIICPIHKGGSRTDTKNDRPVSLSLPKSAK